MRPLDHSKAGKDLPTTNGSSPAPAVAGRPTLLIVGASVRAAAQSAWNAGCQPLAADMFADLDLRRLTGARPVPNYPAGLVSRCRQLAAGSWIYTGALENHPRLLDQLAAERPLLGNPSGVLRRIRDPWQLASAARRAGWQSPHLRHLHKGAADTLRTRSVPSAIPSRSDWLCKPFRSAGGGQIHWHPADESPPASDSRISSRWYLQEYVSGCNNSASFVAAGGQAVLLGTTRQLVGCRWLGASGFQYCGNIGPLPLDDREEAALVCLGNTLACEFNLVGLFGVDYVTSGKSRYLIEVNPRYTASMEVLERSAHFAFVGAHVRACQSGILPERVWKPAGPPWGKAIVYARGPLRVSRPFFAWALRTLQPPRHCRVADIPNCGHWIPRGYPVTTVLASGSDEPSVLRRLKRRVAAVQRLLGG
jgi:predicted ATP-grasp superfamily ATP-dependent carboligase